MDADGDGIGTSRDCCAADYLHGLGVTAIWLMPVSALAWQGRRLRLADYYRPASFTDQDRDIPLDRIAPGTDQRASSILVVHHIM